MEPEIREIALHEKQFEVFNFETQFAAAIAGVQSGKTFVGALWARKNIDSIDGDGMIIAPTFKLLDQSTLQKFFQLNPDLRKYYKKQASVLELPLADGRTRNVYIRSADKPESLEGVTSHWIWMDEAGQMKLDTWYTVKNRVSATGGKILITTTPYNMGWLYQDFFLPWQKKLDNRLSVFTWKSIENPFFSKDHYEAEKKSLPPAEFRKRYEGEFTRMTGLVYELDKFNIIPRKEMVFDKVIGGVDWGWNHPAVIVIGIRPEGYYLLDDWYEGQKTTSDIIDQMKRFQNTYRVSRWYADSANPEKIEESNRGNGLYVVPYEKKRDSISHGISALRQHILEHRLFVFDDLKNTLSEFEAYHYPEELRPGQKEDPVKENDHLMDAMRYAIMGDGPAKTFVSKRAGFKRKNFLSLTETRIRKPMKYEFT